jgi:hypothetical protein
MSDWSIITSICTTRGCQMVYRSPDGLIGLALTSSGRRPDRRRYFVWDLPDSAPEYGSEAEARAAVPVSEETRRDCTASPAPHVP